MMMRFLFFFFSSRRRHTRCSRDWSSDVCSSDLPGVSRFRAGGRRRLGRGGLACSPGSGLAVEGEVLSLVVLDDAKERVVVDDTIRGNLPQQKMDVAGSGDRQSFRGVLRGEGGVITLDGSAGRCGSGRAGGKAEGHFGFDLERGAEFDG